MLRNRIGKNAEECHELRSLLKAVRETLESAPRFSRLEVAKVGKGPGSHAIENGTDVCDDDVRPSVCERRRDQGRHFLIERVAISQNELQRIGSDRRRVERLYEMIEPLAKELLADRPRETHPSILRLIQRIRFRSVN